MVHEITTILEWTAPEFVYKEKKPDWYWALALIILAGIVIAIIDKNFLLGVLILLAGGLFFYFGQKKPITIFVEVSDQGVKINEDFYSYKNIDSFWITKDGDAWKLLLHIHRTTSPLVALPLADGLDPRDVRELFMNFLPESEKAEPLVNRLSDALGF